MDDDGYEVVMCSGCVAFSRPSCKPSQTISYQKVKLHFFDGW